ncbi:MAG: hypothetical protein GY879_05045 [Planctomycetes bacterium]|nr:hypothetical protein [Planctomycetota bacterium]
MKEEYGDDLQIIFVHAQRATFEQSVNFALEREWLQHDVIWTSDYIFSTGGGGLPSFALLDAQGQVILKGSSNSLKGKMEDEIERMVRESGNGPADVPSSVAKVYKELGKGNHAKALVLAEKLKVKPGSKDTAVVLAATEAAITNIHDDLDGQLKRADWLLENGYPIRAEDLVKGLVKGVKGNDTMTTKVKGGLAKFVGEEVEAQLAADKSLTKLANKMFSDGSGEKVGDKIVDIANENISNPIGKRAVMLARVAGIDPGIMPEVSGR